MDSINIPLSDAAMEKWNLTPERSQKMIAISVDNLLQVASTIAGEWILKFFIQEMQEIVEKYALQEDMLETLQDPNPGYAQELEH